MFVLPKGDVGITVSMFLQARRTNFAENPVTDFELLPPVPPCPLRCEQNRGGDFTGQDFSIIPLGGINYSHGDGGMGCQYM